MANSKNKTKKAKQPIKKSKQPVYKQRAPIILFIVLFAIVGAVMLFRSFAAVNRTAVTGVDKFGISKGGLQYLNATARRQKLDQIKDLGARWIRIDINWADIQAGGKTSYNWSQLDALVNDITSRDIKILGDITYTPVWALPTNIGLIPKTPAWKSTWEHYAPADAQNYANFAGKVADRYDGKIEYFEIWNEANNADFFKPKPDAGKYTAMLRRSYTAIKNANSSASVISSGLAPYGQPGQAAADGSRVNPVTFLQRLYAAGIKGYFDALGWHPYNWNSGPPSQKSVWSAWYQMHSTNPSALSVMKVNGEAGKKIWMTEWGYPSVKQAPSITDKVQQAAYLTEGYKLAKGYTWAGPLFWFTLEDGSSGSGGVFDTFGLIYKDGTHKRAYNSYKTAVNQSQ